MTDVIIRQELDTDYTGVFGVNKSAFGRANEGKLVELLRKCDSFIPDLSIVASIDKKVVGHILFTRIKIIDESGNEFESLALAPMAVIPEMQKQGIGGKLILAALNKARELGFKSVIVLGHESYYPRFGFQPSEKWNIKPPFKVRPEVFMAVELTKNGLSGVSGIVHYAKEFEVVE